MDRALAGKRVFVAGDRGMVGQALLRRLAGEECTLLTAPPTLDLRDQPATFGWLAEHRPDVAVIAAARVGGILANDSRPAEFLYDNLAIAANCMEGARQAGVARLLMLGSSCIYPRDAAQPLVPGALLSGPLEPTNQWYAMAKLAALKLVEACRKQYDCDYISALPCNLYGPGDRYDLAASHVLPALIRKAHEAKLAGAGELVVWGSGTPLREFLHVDDLAEACVTLLARYSGDAPVNIGSSEEITIADLARLVAEVVGFSGRIVFDANRPDGMPRKLLDCAPMRALGWAPRIALRAGIADAYADFLARHG